MHRSVSPKALRKLEDRGAKVLQRRFIRGLAPEHRHELAARLPSVRAERQVGGSKTLRSRPPERFEARSGRGSNLATSLLALSRMGGCNRE